MREELGAGIAGALGLDVEEMTSAVNCDDKGVDE